MSFGTRVVEVDMMSGFIYNYIFHRTQEEKPHLYLLTCDQGHLLDFRFGS